MARCKSCHALVTWINLPGRDKPMIFDYEPVLVVQETGGKFMGWSVRGNTPVHGRLLTPEDQARGIAGTRTLVPHWATCPNADQHRRRLSPVCSEKTTTPAETETNRQTLPALSINRQVPAAETNRRTDTNRRTPAGQLRLF